MLVKVSQIGQNVTVTAVLKTHSSATIVEVAPGLAMRLPATVHDANYEIDGHPYHTEVELNMTGEGVRPVRVEVRALDDSPPITSTSLRAVRVWDLVREGLAQGVGRKIEGGMAVLAGVEEVDPAAVRAGGPTPETIELVGRIYNMALVLGQPPNRRVREALDLATSTASDWIRRARDRGLLGEPNTGPRVATHKVKGVSIEEYERRAKLPRRAVGGDE